MGPVPDVVEVRDLTHQIHGECSLLPMLRVGTLSLFHESFVLTLALGIAHGRRAGLALPSRVWSLPHSREVKSPESNIEAERFPILWVIKRGAGVTYDG